MLSPSTTGSYYEATARPAVPHAPLAGSIDCDVCIVGGGIAGCSAALHLAERGFEVVLLEEHRIGWGASGRSGAQALAGTAAGQDTIERLLGRAAARTVWDVTVEALELIPALIQRYGIDCNWVSGQMQVAIKPRHVRELRELKESLARDYDYHSTRFIGREELALLLASSRYIAALYDSKGGHLHPLNYTLGLARALELWNGRIFEGTRALEFTPGAIVQVHTAKGLVRCRQLVLCGNVSLGATAPELSSKIMSVGTCVVATASLGPERASGLIANNAGVSDMNWVLDYFRLTADHRLLFGGRVTYSGFDPARIAASTRHRLTAVFPQLSDVAIDYAWGGYLDITRNRAPHFGRLAPNVYFLQGFSGHGIALAGMGGKLIAEAIAGTAERFDVFARIPHRDFPGGLALRRPALVLAMLYYRLRDLL